MMNADALRLDSIIESIADGNPIDWAAISDEAVGEEQRALKHLHLVAGVAAVHRAIVSEMSESTSLSNALLNEARPQHSDRCVTVIERPLDLDPSQRLAGDRRQLPVKNATSIISGSEFV